MRPRSSRRPGRPPPAACARSRCAKPRWCCSSVRLHERPGGWASRQAGGRMASWRAGWLVGWLVDRLAAWSVPQIAGFLKKKTQKLGCFSQFKKLGFAMQLYSFPDFHFYSFTALQLYTHPLLQISTFTVLQFYSFTVLRMSGFTDSRSGHTRNSVDCKTEKV